MMLHALASGPKDLEDTIEVKKLLWYITVLVDSGNENVGR